MSAGNFYEIEPFFTRQLCILVTYHHCPLSYLQIQKPIMNSLTHLELSNQVLFISEAKYSSENWATK
jgi:hypothetical protein